MKKMFLMFAMALALLASSSNAQEAVKKKLPAEAVEVKKKTLPADASKPIVTPKTQKAATSEFKADVSGVVISLAKLAMGADPIVTKAEAEDLVKKGQPLALKSGEDIFLIYNSKNVFDGKSLAKFADAKNLGVSGEVKYVDGFGVVIAKKVQPVE